MLFGDDITKRVGTDLGLWRRAGTAQHVYAHGQPGLWFIAGGLAQCRIGSKHLALQIKAIEEGLLPRGRAQSSPSLRAHCGIAFRKTASLRCTRDDRVGNRPPEYE